MDERKNILEGVLPDVLDKDGHGNDAKIDPKKSRDILLTTTSEKAEVASHSSVGSCKNQADLGAEKFSVQTDRDCLTTKEAPKRTSEEESSLEAEQNFSLEARKDTVENCLSIVNYDEEVVDVSPNGYTLSALESFSKQESQTISQVQKIYVFDNMFTVLPRSVSRFKNLRSLKIFSNEVRLLPDEVGDIAQLEHLQMKVCPTGLGSLPPLGKLNSLKALELHQAPLRPSVFSLPPEISKLHLLTRLAICNFSISFLPPEIGDLKNLEELDLSFNRLKTLPKEVSGLTALRCLRAENNKLIELPSGLSSLPNLSLIDVAHNKLTSLESLGLSAMTSLRALDAKFNKLRNTGRIPDWITCNLEGNRLPSLGQITSSSEDAVVDSELLPSAGEGEDIPSSAPTSFCSKEVVVQKNALHLKSRRGWKRHDIQQLKARQDRLNISRKSRADCMERPKDGVDDVMVREAVVTQERPAETGPILKSRLLDVGLHQEFIAGEDSEANNDQKRALQCRAKLTCDGKVRQDISSRQDGNGAETVEASCSSHRCKQDGGSLGNFPGLLDDGNNPPVNRGKVIDSHSCRKVISGDRCNQPSNKQSSDDTSIVEGEEELGDAEKFTFKSKEELETSLKNVRRKSGSLDRNPKPRKRRKSAQSFSEVSYAYRSRSLCGFGDRLQDGFYDAGRERSFLSLDVLESEQPCFDSREVILVDREQDEELDAIALSAQQFLTGLELASRNVDSGEDHRLNAFQKAAILSLFVSDCFGGSDKTLNLTNARRAALGGTAGVPFVCSCSSGSNLAGLSNLNESPSSFPGAIPTVHMLCEGAVRLIKMERGSNVVPIGSLPYGVCRHRAILFKYLADRAAIPCELVRGYLDYMPHAWNVILVNKGNTPVRMLIDACRPLDIREEKDPEYFCRYIPLKRFHLPPAHGRELPVSQSDEVNPFLHEEIGRGASGSVVRRCSLGSLTAAAKVHVLDQTAGPHEAFYKDVESKWLSELRILCSLGEHAHIVSFYGHQFSSAPISSLDGKEGSEGFQLMIFMEYVQGCSLENVFSRLAKEGLTHMPAKQASFVARDVAHALSFIHSKGIVHRDIKSSNVLVDFEGDQGDGIPLVKLCDFDSAVPLSSSSSHTCYLAHRGVPSAEVCVGTPRWMAPEVFRAMYGRHPYGLEADIWSFGCLLLELLTLQVPYAGLPESQIQSHIQSGQRPQLPSEIENLVSETMCDSDKANDGATISEEEVKIIKELIRLFKSCTEPCPGSRPSALEAYKALSDTMGSEPINGSKISFHSEEALNTDVSKPLPITKFLKGSSLESSAPALEHHRDTDKCHDSEDIDSCVEESGTK